MGGVVNCSGHGTVGEGRYLWLWSAISVQQRMDGQVFSPMFDDCFTPGHVMDMSECTAAKSVDTQFSFAVLLVQHPCIRASVSSSVG